MAFDGTRGRSLLFGGKIGAFTFLDDTWEWDGSRWTQMSVTTRPAARAGHGLAHDSARGRTVLFAGFSISTYYSDTWEWNGAAWLRATPAVSPQSRWFGTMVHDSARGVVVLFGGSSGATFFADTWEWDGTSWSQRNPATSPPARAGHGMAYDAWRKKVVLFGGSASTFSQLSDTWEYDGVTWTQLAPATKPSARTETAMTYDGARRRVVMFGGFNAFGTGFDADTWEWDGGDWSLRQPAASPTARHRHALSYDPSKARVLLFGGWDGGVDYADTWEYAPVHSATVSAFGSGCAGNVGVPTLAAEPGTLPWLGDQFSARVTSVGINPFLNVPFVSLGDSKTLWGSLALPLDLSGIGMRGCSAYANAFASYALANVGGTALWSITIPPVASLAGSVFYAQAGVTSPGANAFGVALSNACEIRIGAR